MKIDKRVGPYWYKMTLQICPVCLGETMIKERVHGPKPEGFQNIYFWTSNYDHCNEGIG